MSIAPLPASPAPPPRRRLEVLGLPVDAIDLPTAVDRLIDWSHSRSPRVVCLCNVHGLVTAETDAAYRQALQSADLVLPDGAPVAWLQRRLGAKGQRRVAGPDLMEATLDAAQARGVGVFLYGGTPATLQALQLALARRWPGLSVRGAISPAFGQAPEAALDADLDTIAASGAGLLWVALGCPRQERWMAANAPRLPLTQVGVGAAFDFIAGTQPRAPQWMRALGLEWLHRLGCEPRRLLPRYLHTNTRFLWRAAGALLRPRSGP